MEKNDIKLEEVAQRLAQRLVSNEGAQAIEKAAEQTRLRAAKTSQAARLDTKLLQKRVTF